LGVAYGGGLFVAVGDNGTILTSPDAATWTPRTSGTANSLNDITWGRGNFVAVGEGGTIQTSPNGASWTGRPSGTSISFQGVTYGGGIFLTVGNSDTFLTSPDTINWSQRVINYSLFYRGTFGCDTFVMVGENGHIIQSDKLVAKFNPALMSAIMIGATVGSK